jgi:hypothetical protein
MDLGVARVEINHYRYKVLFDWEDTSGETIRKLYQGSLTQPVKTNLILSNQESYTGYFWPMERYQSPGSFLFIDEVTKFSNELPEQYGEVVVNLPAPSSHN